MSDQAGLTEAEHEVIRLLGRAANVFRTQVLGDDERTRDDDLAEFVDKIHQLQHMVLAQAGARAHPDRYRLLGGA